MPGVSISLYIFNKAFLIGLLLFSVWKFLTEVGASLAAKHGDGSILW